MLRSTRDSDIRDELFSVVEKGNLNKLLDSDFPELGADSKSKNSRKESLLHVAAKHGHTTMIVPLLKSGIRIETKDEHGHTPLHFASHYDHLDIVELLLDGDYKANIEAKDYYGQTALHVAASTIKNPLRIVQSLLARGANVNAKSREDITPLHFACSTGNYEIAKLLLNMGADINAQDHCGQTALHVASLRGFRKIVKLLLTNKADLDVKNSNKETPLHLACKQGKTEIVTLLWADKRATNARFGAGFFANLLPFLVTREDDYPRGRTVNLSRRGLDCDDLENLAAVLAINSWIGKLVLAINQFSHAGMFALAEALEVNKTLQILDLSGNSIGSRSYWTSGIQYLAEALKDNTSLIHINLQGCSLDIDDLKFLVNFIKKRKHETLERIDIDMNLNDPNDAPGKFSDEEKKIYLREANTLANTLAFLRFLHKIEKTIPTYKEEEWLALKNKLLLEESQILISELSAEEKNLYLAHEITLYFKEYKSTILSQHYNLATKSSYLEIVNIDALAVLFMEYADITSKSKSADLAPWISDTLRVIDSERPSNLAKRIAEYKVRFSLEDIKDGPAKIFRQSFYNRTDSLRGAALPITSGYVKNEIKTPIENLAEAIKDIIFGLSGFGKIAESATKLLDIAGTEAVKIIKVSEVIGAGAKAMSVTLDSHIGKYGIGQIKEEVIRRIHDLTEEDKLENLKKCFSGNSGYDSKIKSIAHAICHHYYEQIEKLSLEEAEKWGRYAFLHVADLLMSGVIPRSLKQSKEAVLPTAISLTEEIILWLSYAPIRNCAHRTDEILEEHEKESLKNCFMRPTIKFYNEGKIYTARMMVKDSQSFVVSQNEDYPPRWATQKEVDALSDCFNTERNDNQYRHVQVAAIKDYQLIFDQKELELKLELKRGTVHFSTEPSPHLSKGKRLEHVEKIINKLAQENMKLRAELTLFKSRNVRTEDKKDSSLTKSNTF